MGIPVLITTFRRPPLLQRVLNSLPPEAEPVYIWMNGPNNGNDRESISKSLKLLENSEFENLIIKVNTEHFNSGDSIVRAIDWVFEREKFAIILEDDVVPDSRFFSEADYFLNEYADDLSYGGMAATNFVPRKLLSDYRTFRFRKSIFTSSWGWATWKNRWDLFERDLDKSDIEKFIFPKLLNSVLGRTKWRKILTDIASGRTDHWDYRWQYTNWKNGWFTAVPNSNLALNIGFGEDATHTFFKPSWLKNKLEPSSGFSSNFIQDSYNPAADKWILKYVHPIGRWYWAKTYIKRIVLVFLKIKPSSR